MAPQGRFTPNAWEVNTSFLTSLSRGLWQCQLLISRWQWQPLGEVALLEMAAPRSWAFLLTWGFWNPLCMILRSGGKELWLYVEDNPSAAWCQACFLPDSPRQTFSRHPMTQHLLPPQPMRLCVCVCVRSLLQTLHCGWDMNSKHPISFTISLTVPHIRVRGLLVLLRDFCSQAVWLLGPFN